MRSNDHVISYILVQLETFSKKIGVPLPLYHKGVLNKKQNKNKFQKIGKINS